jgi:ribosome-associated protein
MIEITDDLSIPEGEVTFSASQSSGPGGQHVNKVHTRMTLRFDVLDSPSLTETQRALISQKLASRINRVGLLQLHSQAHRSQSRNRQELLERFVMLLQEALHVEKTRRATRPSRTARRKRVEQKRVQGSLKKGRRRDYSDDD